MENKKIISIALISIIIVLIIDAGLIFKHTDSDKQDNADSKDIKTESPVQVINGITAVVVTPEEQNESGITTVKLIPVKHRAELTAYGSVVSIQDLSKDVQSYETDKAQLAKSKEILLVSQKNYERVKNLYNKKLASEQDYQSAQAAYLSDEADVSSASVNLSSTKSSIEQQWGVNLSKWIFNNSPELQRLLSLDDVLIQVSLPPERTGINIPADIFIQSPSDNSKKILCRYVSESRTANSQFQTKTLYYIMPGVSLSSGMNVKAFLPDGNDLTGVDVPSNAVIWYQGSAWIYAEISTGKFARIKINTDNPAGKGFFVPEENILKPGAVVVKDGAQLLLSEELNAKSQNTRGGEGDDD